MLIREAVELAWRGNPIIYQPHEANNLNMLKPTRTSRLNLSRHLRSPNPKRKGLLLQATISPRRMRASLSTSNLSTSNSCFRRSGSCHPGQQLPLLIPQSMATYYHGPIHPNHYPKWLIKDTVQTQALLIWQANRAIMHSSYA